MPLKTEDSQLNTLSTNDNLKQDVDIAARLIRDGMLNATTEIDITPEVFANLCEHCFKRGAEMMYQKIMNNK